MLNNKDFLLRLWRLFQENLHLLVTQTYMYLILNENEKQNKTNTAPQLSNRKKN